MRIRLARTMNRNLTQVTVGPLDVWFSYETPVAYWMDGQPQVVCQNVWSSTTGRHLASLDGGPKTEDGKLRVPHDLFVESLERVLAQLNAPKMADLTTTMRASLRRNTTPDTRDRGLWSIDAVLDGFYDVDGEEPEVPAGDLLADLMHWCAVQDVPFEDVLARAERTYASDCEEWGIRA